MNESEWTKLEGTEIELDKAELAIFNLERCLSVELKYLLGLPNDQKDNGMIRLTSTLYHIKLTHEIVARVQLIENREKSLVFRIEAIQKINQNL